MTKTSAVIILGMHRSGTSSLAGSLQQAGLFLGKVFEANPFNKKGNRESAEIMKLNTDVLQYNGGDWDRPPASISWTEDHAVRRDSILQSLSSGGARVWGFKDPRTTLTLPFWREAINDVQLVGTFRHPLSVAKSLNQRDKFALENGVHVWYMYNVRLLQYLTEKEFPLLCFDVGGAQYANDLHRVCTYLALDCESGKETSFFDPTLRHQSTFQEEDSLPDVVRDLYVSLMKIYRAQSHSGSTQL